MKITTKLLGSYLILAFIVLILGGLSLFGLGVMDSNSDELYTERVQPTIVLSEIAQLMENTRVHMLTGVINADPSRGEPALENIERINELLMIYSDRNLAEDEALLVEELNRSWLNYYEVLLETGISLEEQDFTEAMNGIRQGGAWYGAANMYLTELLDMTEGLSADAFEQNQTVYINLRRMIMFAMLWSTIFAVAVGLLMGRVIGKPLGVISRKLNEVSEGNLTGEVLKTKRKDEIGLLEQATNKMQDELKHIISSVSNATNHVLSSSEELTQSTNEVVQGADQIAITMQELASGSESQANYTSDLSESMSAFVQTIEQSVNDSERVYTTSSKVRQLTDEGQTMMDSSVTQMQTIDQIVKQSVEGMKGPDAKSSEVSSLVTVIEGIAEQTNLLALNAAIEAARAGEQGKGFAVVAEEVRKLSEQVSGSVVEITDIVKQMQRESSSMAGALESGYEEVQKGTTQIQQTGKTFNSISSSVEQMEQTIRSITEKLVDNKAQTIKMSESVEEIASISEQSAAGIEQTSASAQQSTSTMQEVSASSEELARLAEELNQLVERFEV
ncbi:methyl-accepting chemotaxis protein [Alkalibacterium olivapovliticus]|uniref:Methyl-accepting chemotaxis protein n=1 Tax=Alkalibacterium olivapovliticus TaxID=99907 RepID=A0A2T0WA49_9LACT|nr:HAMP domain-containing methyl-accepting chemotaxis protein [Alkalibacterium olivapovliticus]PRY83583.1 methyl-accepting chemotaxis protein [Alkalibacterium olivapovliticus]